MSRDHETDYANEWQDARTGDTVDIKILSDQGESFDWYQRTLVEPVDCVDNEGMMHATTVCINCIESWSWDYEIRFKREESSDGSPTVDTPEADAVRS